MSKKSLVLALIAWAVGAVAAYAQPQVEVLKVEEPEWTWGSQSIAVTVRNNSEYVRFLVMKTTLKCQGEGEPWNIQSRFTTYLPTGEPTKLAPVITVIGNYGTGTVNLTAYDVVDTADVVLPEQKFLDTTFEFTIDMPPEARKWVEQRLVLPPRVDQHPYFYDQYSRLMIQFIAAGIRIDEMARICGSRATYSRYVLGRMQRHGLARLGETAIELNFPYISGKEAEACLPLANRSANLLADAIAGNLAKYESRLDSLVRSGVIPDDRDNLISGTMVLYEPYIMVSALLLWYDLGSSFVTDGKPLQIYKDSDICNAANVSFIYALEADDSLAGRHFFALMSRQEGDGILFADHDPELVCSGNYPARPGVAAKATYEFPEDDRPEFFFLDTTLARPALDGLGKGTSQIVDQTYADLKDLAGQYGRTELAPAYKYWFWNLVATKTLDLLTQRGAVKGRGTNNFQLGSVSAR